MLELDPGTGETESLVRVICISSGLFRDISLKKTRYFSYYRSIKHKLLINHKSQPQSIFSRNEQQLHPLKMSRID